MILPTEGLVSRRIVIECSGQNLTSIFNHHNIPLSYVKPGCLINALYQQYFLPSLIVYGLIYARILEYSVKKILSSSST
jgi:hypothetical protein